jgi:ATP-dependent RNA helicase DDX5/DBP2
MHGLQSTPTVSDLSASAAAVPFLLLPQVKSIASQFVRNHPVHVFVGGVEEKLVANKAITQVVMVVNQHEKMSQLTALLRSKPRGTKAIIFAGTKRM